MSIIVDLVASETLGVMLGLGAKFMSGIRDTL